MKRSTKILFFVLLIAVIVTATGCGGADDPNTVPPFTSFSDHPGGPTTGTTGIGWHYTGKSSIVGGTQWKEVNCSAIGCYYPKWVKK